MQEKLSFFIFHRGFIGVLSGFYRGFIGVLSGFLKPIEPLAIGKHNRFLQFFIDDVAYRFHKNAFFKFNKLFFLKN